MEDITKRIVGTWRLVRSISIDSNGKSEYPYGKDAIGYIIYNDTGVMAVQISRRSRDGAGDVSRLERDYLAYRRLFELVVQGLPRPGLLVYLKAPVSTLMERIHRRARNIETGISAEYLSLLDTFYDEWLKSFDLCPVLTIRTDDLDYVNRPQHLETVVARIQDKLAGKEVMDLRG